MDKQIVPCRVCVAGGSGRIGSLLVRKLLERGHVVHATVRNLRDPEKTEVLKSFPGADARLHLFEADLFKAHQFEQAIHGCAFVFLVAFPTRPPAENFQQGDPGEAMLAALQTILGACERSGTVRRLIYTGSATTASPLGVDGIPSKDFIDESCWTTPELRLLDDTHSGLDFPKFYVSNKTASERRLMSYGDHNKEGENSSLEVVVLSCGLVGGGALVGKTTGVEHLISPLTGDTVTYRVLAFLQKLLCSVPLVHQDDACEAHVFCMGVPLTHGRRFLCASSYPTLREIIAYYQQNHAAHRIEPEECQDSSIKGGSTKLRDVGFEYKYGMDQILDDSFQFAKKVGLLKDG